MTDHGSLNAYRPPRLRPNGKARKCAYFACRRATVTHVLCERHRDLEWARSMYLVRPR